MLIENLKKKVILKFIENFKALKPFRRRFPNVVIKIVFFFKVWKKF